MKKPPFVLFVLVVALSLGWKIATWHPAPDSTLTHIGLIAIVGNSGFVVKDGKLDNIPRPPDDGDWTKRFQHRDEHGIPYYAPTFFSPQRSSPAVIARNGRVWLASGVALIIAALVAGFGKRAVVWRVAGAGCALAACCAALHGTDAAMDLYYAKYTPPMRHSPDGTSSVVPPEERMFGDVVYLGNAWFEENTPFKIEEGKVRPLAGGRYYIEPPHVGVVDEALMFVTIIAALLAGAYLFIASFVKKPNQSIRISNKNQPPPLTQNP